MSFAVISAIFISLFYLLNLETCSETSRRKLIKIEDRSNQKRAEHSLQPITAVILCNISLASCFAFTRCYHCPKLTPQSPDPAGAIAGHVKPPRSLSQAVAAGSSTNPGTGGCGRSPGTGQELPSGAIQRDLDKLQKCPTGIS